MKKDHVKAGTNDIKGNVKEAAGKAIDDKYLEAEGKADQLKAKAQDFVGDVKEAVD